MNRYIIGALAFLGLAILLIVLLFTGGGGKKTIAPTEPSLVSYADTNAVVKLVVDGPVVAPEDHNSVDVSVSQNSASVEVFQGYNGEVIASKTYNNTENSFKNFLYSLYYAGYSKGGTSPYTSDIGLCSTGRTYDLYLTNNGQTLQHYWQTDCSGPKTFDGNLGLTITLFEKQIPNISNIIANANL
ncbi:MAG TPA: hypothetical protein VGF75_00845 [Candidatus Saccharimonadales bacterium]|jgi:hypothetical protein